MISMELFNEVMGIKVYYFEFMKNNEYIEFRESNGFLKKINIYELAYNCKEWAGNKGYIVEVGVYPVNKINKDDRDYFYTVKGLCCNLLITSKEYEIIKTEYEAIFKACEWVLIDKK